MGSGNFFKFWYGVNSLLLTLSHQKFKKCPTPSEAQIAPGPHLVRVLRFVRLAAGQEEDRRNSNENEKKAQHD